MKFSTVCSKIIVNSLNFNIDFSICFEIGIRLFNVAQNFQIWKIVIQGTEHFKKAKIKRPCFLNLIFKHKHFLTKYVEKNLIVAAVEPRPS